ncbi:MAG: uroporphyrinogen-III C-methyltransferase [Austwickia sp.]|nr:MAG: uroporphyrinogen-III C-methyltransferase [Austwickia sp.]
MLVELSLTGTTVAILGDERATARARLRYLAAGARLIRLTTPARAEAYAWTAAAPDARATDRPGLVVDVTGGALEWVGAVRALTRLAPATREEPAPARAGTITLAGAGPGDPGLHTVATREALAAADLVLLDRLADHDARADIRALAPAARIVDVGKTPGHHRMSQAEIERHMIEAAATGAHVVRLKGGDPFVFGRGGEEVAAASAAGIPVTVIPGISSAFAAPAAAGIPVTHRETSRAVTVLSGHDPVTPELAEHLVGLDATVVLLMGMAALPQTVAELRRAGLPGDTPAAVVQEGCTPRQRYAVTTLDRLVDRVHADGLTNPSVVVIGAVAALAHGHLSTEPRTTQTLRTARRTDDLENAR